MSSSSPTPPQVQALLDQLHDIIVPSPVGAWPPAPGWWIGGGMLLAALLCLIVMLLQRWWRNRYRRAALQYLDALPEESVEEIAALLKRAAFTAYPAARDEIATLFGPPWVEFLNKTCKNPPFSGEAAALLAGGLYRPDARSVPALKTQAAHWLAEHQHRADQWRDALQRAKGVSRV